MYIDKAVSELTFNGKILTQPSRQGDLELTEKGEQSTMKVAVFGLPSLSISLRLHQRRHSSIINSGRWKQNCDYLIIAEHDGDISALLVELKETARNGSNAMEQLRRSYPIARYVLSVLGVEFDMMRRLDRLTVRYAILAEKYSKNFDKQTVRIHPANNIHTLKHKEIVIASFVGPRVNFNLLMKSCT